MQAEVALERPEEIILTGILSEKKDEKTNTKQASSKCYQYRTKRHYYAV
jgi:hypothetical protein